MPKTKKQATWSVADIMIGVGDASWIIVGVEGVGDLHVDDYLLFDGTLTKPKPGDYVVYQTAPGHFYCAVYDHGYEYDGVLRGIGVAAVRPGLRKKTRQRATSHKADDKQRQAEIASLTRKLDRIERLPENEGAILKLETEIYKLENGSCDPFWPDVIA